MSCRKSFLPFGPLMILPTLSPRRKDKTNFFFIRHSGQRFGNLTCRCTGSDVSQIEASVSHFPCKLMSRGEQMVWRRLKTLRVRRGEKNLAWSRKVFGDKKMFFTMAHTEKTVSLCWGTGASTKAKVKLWKKLHRNYIYLTQINEL